jgi:SAM-dependent methyltransferase
MKTPLRQRVRRIGIVDAAVTCLRALRTQKWSALRILRQRIRNEWFAPPDTFDQTFGVETRLAVWRKRLFLKPDSIDYEAVNPQLFVRAISHAPRVTFIDLGCGKGRGLILAHQAGFQDLIGVEMSASLVKAAISNLRKLGITAEIVQADAAVYDFPARPLVVFMYNPFGIPTMQAVVEKLRSSRYPVHVIYINPRHRGLFSGFHEIYTDPAAVVLSTRTQGS